MGERKGERARQIISSTTYQGQDEMVGGIKGHAEEKKATKCASCEQLDAFHALSHVSLTNHLTT